MQSFLSWYGNDVDQLNNEDVLAILARRQEIRPLQGVYLNHSIQGQYRRSNFPVGRRECNEIIDCMFQETEPDLAAQLSQLSIGNGLAERDAPNKPFSGCRFSDAVVALWVIVEARRMAMVKGSQAQYLGDIHRYHDIMMSFWCGNWKRTPLQTLDLLEVHDFLYGFLMRKIFFRVGEASAKISGHVRDRVMEARDAPETEAIDEEWARHLQLFALCMAPVEAAKLGSLEVKYDTADGADVPSREDWPINQTSRYLQVHEIPPPLINHGLETLSMATLLEFTLGYELLQLEAKDKAEGVNGQLVEAWAHFRRNWPTTARGSIFQSMESSEEFLEKLRRWVPEAEPAPSDDSPPALESSEEFLEQWRHWVPEAEPAPSDDSPPALKPNKDSFSLSLSRKVLESWTW